MGQIDLARISKTKTGRFIEVGEVKSSIVGIEAIERSQKARLYASCNFLGKIFSLGVKLIKLVG
jgi:hypothetical protein